MNDDVNLGGEPAEVGVEEDVFADVPGDPIPDGEPQEPPYKDVSDGPDEERLGGVDDEPEPEPEPDEEEPVKDEPEAADAEPEPEPEKPSGSAKRDYLAFEQIEGGDEPVFKLRTTVCAYNGDAATRDAFKELFGDSLGEAKTLVLVPERGWRTRTVEGRAKSNVAIDIS